LAIADRDGESLVTQHAEHRSQHRCQVIGAPDGDAGGGVGAAGQGQRGQQPGRRDWSQPMDLDQVREVALREAGDPAQAV